MLKFGILGLGEGGTNIAEYAFMQGFKTVIANTAKIDLEKAKYIPQSCKIELGGRGAGRERTVGIEAMINSAQEIYDKCEKEFSDCDAVFVVAAGGGGTGSGGLPIGLEILMGFHKYVGAIIILPDEMESPKAKMNTLECFGQLSEFDNLGSVFIIDNEKAKQIHTDFSRRNIYQVTNKQIIDFLVELNKLTSQSSYVSNFDAGDFLSVIQERGYTHISKADYYSDGLDNSYEIAKRIRDSWNQNYQPIFTDGQIRKGAIIGKIPERLSSKVDINLIFQETGIPYDFNDIYFNPDQNNFSSKVKNTFYTILSGLAFPQTRLGKIDQGLKKIEDKLIDSFNKSQTQKFNTESWNSKFAKKVVNLDVVKPIEKGQKINLVDKLNKYK